MKSDQLLTKTAINVDDILVKRNRDKVSHSIFFMVVMAMALWSVNVRLLRILIGSAWGALVRFLLLPEDLLG